MSSSSSSLTLTLTLTLILSLILTLTHSLALSQPSEAQVRPRPDPRGNAAAFARWLVSQSSWGWLATVDAGAVPFCDVISFSDGDTGVPFFYLSARDPTGINAANGSLASFTLSEAVLGFCSVDDPQSPACARITLSGTLKLLVGADAEFGEAAIFAKHPQLMGLMGFQVYAMGINDIYLLNEKAPRKKLTVEDYLGANFG